MWRWSAETLPASTRMVKMRETRKRKEVTREKMRRVRVAALIVDFEGGSVGAGVGLGSGSSEETVER